MDGLITKQCSYCQKVKSLDDFYKHPTQAHGVGSRCRMCCSKLYRKRAQAIHDIAKVKICVSQIRDILARVDVLLGKDA